MHEKKSQLPVLIIYHILINFGFELLMVAIVSQKMVARNKLLVIKVIDVAIKL